MVEGGGGFSAQSNQTCLIFSTSLKTTKFYELGTFKWDILDPDWLIILEINNKRKQALFNLEIKKKSESCKH